MAAAALDTSSLSLRSMTRMRIWAANSKRLAMTEQAFIRALKQAVDAQDEQEAARLVREHKQALEAFLERMLAQLAFEPNGTLH